MSTLYISGQEVEARLDDRRIVMNWLDWKADDVVTLMAPLHDIEQVVVIGYPQITMQVLHAFAHHGIPVYLLTPHAWWVGSILPNVNGYGARRLRQYATAEDEGLSLLVAKALVIAKLKNMRRVLQRLAGSRERSREMEQMNACNSLASLVMKCEDASSLESIRGYEGMGTAVYFQRLRVFFPEDMPFTTRSRRPPKDEANALMSWTYTIVCAEVETAIRTAGLDPCFGFLHELSTGRASLAYDLIEPLRAPLCDLLTLNLLNHKFLTKKHFRGDPEDGGVYLRDEARKIFFSQYEMTMERRFSETKGGVHVTFRKVIRNMVYEVCKAIETREVPYFFIMP